MVARAGAGPVLVAALIVGAAAWVHGHRPRQELPPSVETLIVIAQRERAVALPPTDVLVVGDSSALMGVDPVALGARIGDRHVESLAVLAWVGPAGYAALLDRVLAKQHPGTVVVLMNAAGLELSEEVYDSTGYEAMVLRDLPGPERQQRQLADVGDGLFFEVIQPAVDFWLPGSFGRTYGTPEDFVAFIRGHQGAAIDPNRYDYHGRTVTFRLSEATERRMAALRDALTRTLPATVRFGVTPVPESEVRADSSQSRAPTIEAARTALGLARDATLDLPLALPDADFATPTHLGPPGRGPFVEALAKALSH
jgi:hypothetical protein